SAGRSRRRASFAPSLESRSATRAPTKSSPPSPKHCPGERLETPHISRLEARCNVEIHRLEKNAEIARDFKDLPHLRGRTAHALHSLPARSAARDAERAQHVVEPRARHGDARRHAAAEAEQREKIDPAVERR